MDQQLPTIRAIFNGIIQQRHQEQHYLTINQSVVCLDNGFWPKAVYMKFTDANGGDLYRTKRNDLLQQ